MANISYWRILHQVIWECEIVKFHPTWKLHELLLSKGKNEVLQLNNMESIKRIFIGALGTQFGLAAANLRRDIWKQNN